MARALEAGVMGFLLKPLRPGQLAPTLDLAVARFRDAQRLQRALHERKVIERAKGLLMAREGLTEDDAFRTLRTTAMNMRRPMVEVARDVLGGPGSGGGAPPAAPQGRHASARAGRGRAAAIGRAFEPRFA